MTAEHRLRRRHVVITGAARGIGLATAGELRRRGARVTIGDVDHLAAKHAAEGLGDDVTALPLDVTDPDGFAAFEKTRQRHHLRLRQPSRRCGAVRNAISCSGKGVTGGLSRRGLRTSKEDGMKHIGATRPEP